MAAGTRAPGLSGRREGGARGEAERASQGELERANRRPPPETRRPAAPHRNAPLKVTGSRCGRGGGGREGVHRVARRAGRGRWSGERGQLGSQPCPCVNSLRPTIKNGLKLLECSHCPEPPAAGEEVLNQVFGVS